MELICGLSRVNFAGKLFLSFAFLFLCGKVCPFDCTESRICPGPSLTLLDGVTLSLSGLHFQSGSEIELRVLALRGFDIAKCRKAVGRNVVPNNLVSFQCHGRDLG